MAIYSVLEPPVAGDMRLAKAVVIRDGFSVVAFIAPLIWFLWHRMWLEALGVVLIGALLGAISLIPGLEIVPALGILVSLFAGMEARNLRINALRRRGWTEWGVVVASSEGEAELRYMNEALGHAEEEDQRLVPAGAPTEARPGVFRPSPMSTFGLIDYPRKA